MGYQIDAECEGRGLMTEALRLAIDFMFARFGLHRIMANYIPDNHRSGRVLERLGFEKEGYARNYLFIDGAWRDHVLTALINPHPAAPVRSEEHTSELQSLMRISYSVFCLNKKTKQPQQTIIRTTSNNDT